MPAVGEGLLAGAGGCGSSTGSMGHSKYSARNLALNKRSPLGKFNIRKCAAAQWGKCDLGFDGPPCASLHRTGMPAQIGRRCFGREFHPKQMVGSSCRCRRRQRCVSPLVGLHLEMPSRSLGMGDIEGAAAQNRIRQIVPHLGGGRAHRPAPPRVGSFTRRSHIEGPPMRPRILGGLRLRIVEVRPGGMTACVTGHAKRILSCRWRLSWRRI